MRTFYFSEKKGPRNPIRYTFEGRVEDLLVPSQPNTLYYLEVSMQVLLNI